VQNSVKVTNNNETTLNCNRAVHALADFINDDEFSSENGIEWTEEHGPEELH
jgi:hypothetical protein